MGVYRIEPKTTKFIFTLHDDGDAVILTSVEHATKAAAALGIQEVRLHSQSIGNYQRIDGGAKWSFNLNGAGKKLGKGADHGSAQAREAGITAVKYHAKASPVEAEVITKKKTREELQN